MVQQHVDVISTARNGVIDDVPITVEARAGQPGPVLCDATGDADLLVVGRNTGPGTHACPAGSIRSAGQCPH